MRFANGPAWILVFVTLLLAACAHPISREVRSQVDPEIDLAVIGKDPSAFLDRQILVGGAIQALETTATGSVLEVLEWQLNRWGEPAWLDDSGRRFLVRTPQELDPEQYQTGVLVTLAGSVLGHETRPSGAGTYDYPILGLTEIHLWRSPFRYGIHRHVDPGEPTYVGDEKDPARHPYDPGYSTYPYTQHWYRQETD